jgi:CubicO group peptidase (beta-lactamase class C family)
MNVQRIVRFICFALILSLIPSPALAEDFTNAIYAFLQHRVEVDKVCVGMVVGLVDEYGSRVVSYGPLDNATDQEMNGGTVFAICSVTKTFTGLLLQGMVERGKMKLEDPVAEYLPRSVRMPTRHGKEITLRQLATHSSGLPKWPDDLNPDRARAGFSLQDLAPSSATSNVKSGPGAATSVPSSCATSSSPTASKKTSRSAACACAPSLRRQLAQPRGPRRP